MADEPAIYRSAQGDVWCLVPDVEAKQVFVRYEPDQASGKRSTLVDLNTFLSEEHGPQREALTHLLHEVGYLLPSS
jgi:hypothetical protein